MYNHSMATIFELKTVASLCCDDSTMGKIQTIINVALSSMFCLCQCLSVLQNFTNTYTKNFWKYPKVIC